MSMYVSLYYLYSCNLGGEVEADGCKVINGGRGARVAEE